MLTSAHPAALRVVDSPQHSPARKQTQGYLQKLARLGSLGKDLAVDDSAVAVLLASTGDSLAVPAGAGHFHPDSRETRRAVAGVFEATVDYVPWPLEVFGGQGHPTR